MNESDIDDDFDQGQFVDNTNHYQYTAEFNFRSSSMRTNDLYTSHRSADLR